MQRAVWGPLLSDQQRRLLDRWLPGYEVVADHSWGLSSTKVLEVSYDDRRFIVKAAGPEDHHLLREINAHQRWLRPWTERERATLLLHHDADARLIVTTFLPGVLVEGHTAQDDPQTYQQAGELLWLLHRQSALIDPDFERTANARTLRWLDGPHRISAALAAQLRDLVISWPPAPAVLVPTHGDYQPRNWLIHHGQVCIIDHGRADLRPAMTDFARLAAQDFRREPALEQAFLTGYGIDPRERGSWWRAQLREAIATAAWAYTVGDERFEQQGHRMITETLASGP